MHSGMETGSLLGPSDERQGPKIHIKSNELRRIRLQPTPARRRPSRIFSFQSGMPMRAHIIDIPGLSQAINPVEHVWNQLSSITDASFTNDIYPMAASMSEPLNSCETLSTTLIQSMRQLSISVTSSPPTSVYQSTSPSVASPTGSVQTDRRTESCSSSPTMSSSRPPRPIIDGSLKSFE